MRGRREPRNPEPAPDVTVQMRERFCGNRPGSRRPSAEVCGGHAHEAAVGRRGVEVEPEQHVVGRGLERGSRGLGCGVGEAPEPCRDLATLAPDARAGHRTPAMPSAETHRLNNSRTSSSPIAPPLILRRTSRVAVGSETWGRTSRRTNHAATRPAIAGSAAR